MMNERKQKQMNKRKDFREKLNPAYQAKDAVLHSFITYGKKHRILKYPVFLVLFIFLFTYHFLVNLFIQMHMRAKLAKAFAVILVITLIVGSIQLPILAFDDANTSESFPTEEAPEEDLTDLPEEAPEEDLTDLPEETPEEDPEETPTNLPEETPEENPEETPTNLPEETPEEEISDVTPEELQYEGVEESIAPEEPQQDEISSFNEYCDIEGIRIKVSADPGVFPAGSVLSVEKICNNEDINKIEQLVTDVKNEDTAVNVSTKVEQSYTFDIVVLDQEGNPVEPDVEKGQVYVVFENIGATEAEQNAEKELSVFYVEDDYSNIEELNRSIDESQDAAIIEAEHFSIYTVVITKQDVEDTILHYYQASSMEKSYFTIYTEAQLLTYRKLLENYFDGTLNSNDKFSTILVNSDESNPIDGITGLGQSTDMTLSDLNFSAKIMNDITVSNWTPISQFTAGIIFNGAGHTLQFSSVTGISGTAEERALVTNNSGMVTDITLKWSDQTAVIEKEEEPSEEYASVTILVDGQKAEIGEAITGAEALAISADGGQTYTTLVRDDDLAVYRTPLSNLFPEEVTDKQFDVFYVYEDENDLLSSVVLSADNHYQIELNYLSVTYDLEGANTFALENGVLSEDVMSSVRVNVKPDGSYEALEDYEAVVAAADGYEITMVSEKSKVWVNNVEIGCGVANGYSYVYDAANDYGTFRIPKSVITGPVKIQVRARTKEDYDKCTVVLHTRCSSVVDPLWTESGLYEYSQIIYGQPVTLPESKEIRIMNGSSSIQFAGWYADANCTQPVTDNMSGFSKGSVFHYYAKYTLACVSAHNNKTYYNYSTGTTDVRGWDGQSTIKTTFGDAGLAGFYSIGSVPGSGSTYSYSGTGFRFSSSVNSDAFSRVGSTDIYIAQIYSYGSANDPFTTVTYVLENRGSSSVSNLNIAFGADVQIGSGGNSDSAQVSKVSDGSASYVCMTADGKEYRTYVSGSSFGVDAVSRCWYGYYSTSNLNGSGWSNNVFNNGRDANYSSGDSAMAFSWCGLSIAPGKVITRTIKLGMGVTADMNILTARFDAGTGKFSNGSSVLGLESRNKNIQINATTGNITVDGSSTYAVPTRAGYKFAYWSLSQGNYDDDPAPAKYSGAISSNTTLYAVWIPQPDKSVTNDSSVQKVNGSDSLLVPAELGNIVVYNTTPGVDIEKIKQGESVDNAAGYAAGFSAVIAMEGSDDRYLLPDDIEVLITDDNGNVTTLTRGTGYEYTRWNNRKKADLVIKRQYINGDVTIRAIGYGLPPVTPTSLSVDVPVSSISYGDKAIFTATATTSKNHIATYQWYVAPYYEITLDDVNWDYQNQNGELLQNGLYNGTLLFQDGNTAQNVYISGANKSTLRISGLPVNNFTDDASKTPMNGQLRLGGYHVYCVVTSVRNITGQEVTSVSDTVQLEVSTATYSAPTGLEGSATTYNGSTDGSIIIMPQADRPSMKYKKSTALDWLTVTDDMLRAGEITGLASGTYQFKYIQDANHYESSITEVVVEPGRPIVITYKASGANDENSRTQYKHVTFGTNVSASTPSLNQQDGTILSPEKTGYTFSGWSPSLLNNVQEDSVIDAVYTPKVYQITLNQQGADVQGQSAIYEKYSTGFYLENACVNAITSTRKVVLPTREGYDFLGYYTQESGGIQMITQDGCLAASLLPTRYLENTAYYAQWKEKEVTINSNPVIQGPGPESSTPEISLEIKPEEPAESEEEIDSNSSYEITVTKISGKSANVVFVYSNGELKKTITGVIFDSKNQYTFTLIPAEVGGGTITIGIGYIDTVKDTGEDKSQDEIEEDAENLGTQVNYNIIYRDTSTDASGADFSGVFCETAPAVGITGIETTLPLVVKSGYNFAGWYLKGRGTGSAVSSISADNVEKTVTVYAKWVPNKYNLVFNRNGGAYSNGYTPASQYEHDGESIVLPTQNEIKRDNYVFLGWFDNADCQGTPITTVDTGRIGTLTYYAGWEVLPLYTITLPEPPRDSVGTIYEIASAEGFSTSVYSGKAYHFTLELAPAYQVLSVKANGKVVSHEGTEYVMNAITDDVTITVSYEKIVETDESEMNQEDVVATIVLSDGSTGYFDDLDKAIVYAAEHGMEIFLQQDVSMPSIEIPSGKPIVLNQNGHELNGNILVDAGAELTIAGTPELPAEGNLSIENRGTLHIGEGVMIDELLNLGLTENNGTVNKLLQQDSESQEKSKFINNGTINEANLQDGYFVQNADNGQAPSGLNGYSTIMNGNEFYVSLQDALDIANESETDSNIQILNNVDNLNKVLDIGNSNDKKITLDLNGHTISNGNININGPVEIANSTGSASASQNITAEITNNDELTLTENVNVKSIINKENATLVAEEGSKISGSLLNESGGNVHNQGTITAITTNKGNFWNEASGVMNNVTQEVGDFVNEGEITTKIELKGGKYTAEEDAIPQSPAGAVASSDTIPSTFYGTMKDAIDDINQMDSSGPDIKLSLLQNIENLGTDTLIIDTKVPLDIDLNGYEINTGDKNQTIQIGSDETEENAPVQFSDHTVTAPETASIHVPVDIKDSGKLTLNDEIEVDSDIHNNGSLTNKGTLNGELTSNGSTTNEGNITGDVTNNGDFINRGTINEFSQENGNLTNEEAGIIDHVTQSGGQFNNTGDVDTLNQTGGETNNAGSMNTVTVDGGGFTGNDPEESDEIQKAAKIVITDPNGEEKTIYFATLQDALEYAAQADTSIKIVLLQEIEETALSVVGDNTNDITIDLNGNNLNSPSGVLSIGEDIVLSFTDESAGTKGEVLLDGIDNRGKLTIEESVHAEGTYTGQAGSELLNKGNLSGEVIINHDAVMTNDGTIESTVENNGDVINHGIMENDIHNGDEGTIVNDTAASITGKVTNEGQLDNKGILSNVEQNNGSFINESGATTEKLVQNGGDTANAPAGSNTEPGKINNMKMNEGSFEGEEPLTTTSDSKQPVAKIGDKYYTSLQQAVEDANHASEKTAIKLLDDIVLPNESEMVIGNEYGNEIVIDLNGNDISGGAIIVNTPEDGKFTLRDDSTPHGTISSPISVAQDSELIIEEGITVDTDIENKGTIENNGTITGTLNNSGDVQNNGSINDVVMEDGELQNKEDATITNLTQKGGEITNEGYIEEANVTGGFFDGNDADSMEYAGAEVVVETITLDESGNPVVRKEYYPSLSEALENAPEDAKITLLKNIEINNDLEIPKSGITIDLKGHEIGGTGSLNVGAGVENIKIDDTAEETDGCINIPLINEGELLIEENVTTGPIENHGHLSNSGNVLGELINAGQLINAEEGIIKDLVQEAGDFVNKGNVTDSFIQNGGNTNNENTIENSKITGGSYSGTDPERTMEGSAPFSAAIGDKKYVNLTDALQDAKKADADIEVKLLQNIDLGNQDIVLENENDKKITLNLNHYDLSGNGNLNIKSDAEIKTDNAEGNLEMEMTIDSDTKLLIDQNVVINEKIDNYGEITNQGTILDDIHNREDAILQNKGEESYIGGNILNEGQMDNEGSVNGTIQNSGELENTGNLDGDVNNKDNGNFSNHGNVTGQLTNQDNATADNAGTIHQLLQNGGSLTNNGVINSATISDMTDYKGDLPQSGFEHYNFMITYKDNNGNTITDYYDSLDEACEAAENVDSQVEIMLLKPTASVNGDIEIPQNATLKIEDGKKLFLEDGSTLNNLGKIQNQGTLMVDGGNMENNGTIENKGTIEKGENGSIVNNGTIHLQQGTIIGDIENNGTIDRPAPAPVPSVTPEEEKDPEEIAEEVTEETDAESVRDTKKEKEPVEEDAEDPEVEADHPGETGTDENPGDKVIFDSSVYETAAEAVEAAIKQGVETKPIEEITEGVTEGSTLVQVKEGYVLVTVESLNQQGVSDETAISGVLLSQLEDTIAACFSEEEIALIGQGGNAEVKLVITRTEQNDKKDDWDIAVDYLTNQYSEQERPVPIETLDISILVRMEEGNWTQKHDLKDEITISFDIPEDLLFESGKYSVLRVHQGVVTELPDLDTVMETVTIKTKQLSTYILSYEAVAADYADAAEPLADKTNQKNVGILPIIGICIGAAFIILIILWLRRKKEKQES